MGLAVTLGHVLLIVGVMRVAMPWPVRWFFPSFPYVAVLTGLALEGFAWGFFFSSRARTVLGAVACSALVLGAVEVWVIYLPDPSLLGCQFAVQASAAIVALVGSRMRFCRADRLRGMPGASVIHGFLWWAGSSCAQGVCHRSGPGRAGAALHGPAAGACWCKMR